MTTTATAANQVAKQQQQGIDRLKTVLYAPSVQTQFQNALGKHADKFVASVIDLYNTDQRLKACNPDQVVMEALKAAVMNLPINKQLGYAYILSFKNKGVATPTFVIGYKGLIQLAIRTGQYRYINADVVYEGEIGSKDKLTGSIAFDGQKSSEKVIGYFAHIELMNGYTKTLYSTLEEVAKHAKKYAPSLKFDTITAEQLAKLAGKDPTDIGWKGDFDSMALKTVLRELLSKYGYLSIDMQQAVSDDQDYAPQSERDAAIQDVEAKVISMDEAFEENQPEDAPAEPGY